MLGEKKGLGPKITLSKNYRKNPSETVSHSGGCKTDHLKIYSLRYREFKTIKKKKKKIILIINLLFVLTYSLI